MSIPYSPSGTPTLTIDYVLLPLGVNANASGGPVTKTAITEGASGKEKRYSYMPNPRRQYTGGFGPDYTETILGIWIAGIGPRYGFMLQDPSDYKLTTQVAAHIDATHAQVQKTYTRTDYFTSAIVRSNLRNILLPDPNTMSVFRNAVLDATWTLGYDGVMTTSSAMSTGDVITVTGEFFVPVRMADDQFNLLMHVKDLKSIQTLNFIEVLPGDLP